jgi:hypothetical protein
MIGVLNAIITTTNRATGAYLYGDANSLALQLAALPGFETQLDSVAAQLPAQFAAWGQELVSEGIDPATFTLADVTAAQQNIAANGFPGSVQTELTNLGLDQTTIQQAQTLIAGADPQRAFEVLQNRFQVGPLMPPVLPTASNLQLYAAVLPESHRFRLAARRPRLPRSSMPAAAPPHPAASRQTRRCRSALSIRRRTRRPTR